MIWRCGCGHKVSRHDDPRYGQRSFYCIPERGIRTFIMRPEDQRKPRTVFKKQSVVTSTSAMKRGDYLESTEEGDDV